jgi:hypothetical protein
MRTFGVRPGPPWPSWRLVGTCGIGPHVPPGWSPEPTAGFKQPPPNGQEDIRPIAQPASVILESCRGMEAKTMSILHPPGMLPMTYR